MLTAALPACLITFVDTVGVCQDHNQYDHSNDNADSNVNHGADPSVVVLIILLMVID